MHFCKNLDEVPFRAPAGHLLSLENCLFRSHAYLLVELLFSYCVLYEFGALTPYQIIEL